MGQQRRGKATNGVEIATFEIVRIRVAVTDVDPDARKRSEKRPRLAGEGVLPTVTSALKPPDLPVGVLLGQRMEHCQDRGCPDAGTDEQHRRLRPIEDEGATRCRDLELVADREPRVQVTADDATGLALDRDPVIAPVRRSGE